MPLSSAHLTRYERLVAPATHLGLLIEPPAADWRAVLAAASADAYVTTALLDTTIGTLRTRLRARLGLRGPVIVTGHQAEFFHAGVLAKNLVAQHVAGQTGGSGVFLLVDSDLPKTAQLAVPQLTSGGLRRIDVAIPGHDGRAAFEAQPRVPREHWRQFFERVASLHEFATASLLRPYAEAWLATDEADIDYCDALARAVAATESLLGAGGLRGVRMSALASAPEFRAFAAHLLLNADRFAGAYNAAQAGYRRRHHVRAAGRPVPPLSSADSRIELPFWIGRTGQPRRRLFVAQRGPAVEILADAVLVGRVSRSELEKAATHAEPWEIERNGWHLRPRALALSAFARLFLADLFIHGIGGAKYDEIMEDAVAEFWGVAPAAATCVSATLHLPLPHHDVGIEDIRAARHQSRDLRFNPQRHVSAAGPLAAQRTELVRQAEGLRAYQPWDHAARRLLFREIRRVNEQILEADPWRAAQYDQRVQTLEVQRQLDRVALNREYFYALHPRPTLMSLAQTLRAALPANGSGADRCEASR